MNTPQRQNGADCVHPGESGRPLLSPDLGGCQEDEAGHEVLPVGDRSHAVRHTALAHLRHHAKVKVNFDRGLKLI